MGKGRSILLQELKCMKAVNSPAPENAEVDISLVIPARNSASSLENTTRDAHRFLSQRTGLSFEIVLVPNPRPGDTADQTPQVAEKLAKELSQVRVCPHQFPPGKGAALRTGVLATRGRWVFLTDSDLPYDLSFFDEAILKLRSGYDLVTGNRRLPSSHFNIPVELLPLAYGRHRLGLAFNRLVRFLLPISTTDTQAGIKALSRRLALEAFSKMSCPGFLFDLEIFLTANSRGYRVLELPVTLYLNSEKTTVKILKECILVANWLTRISWKNFRKGYAPDRQKIKTGILRRFKEASPGTRVFLFLRWLLTPYGVMASRLPEEGTILDLGCGHGLFSFAAASGLPKRQVVGIDHDEARISLGAKALQGLSNIRLEKGSLLDPPQQSLPYSGIAMIDVLHYFEPNTQEKILKRAHELLDSCGTLVIREVDPNGGMVSKWNRLYEKIATGIGFTQAEPKGLHFRSQSGWKDLMEKAGFKVRSERCSSFLFADILYTCEKL